MNKQELDDTEIPEFDFSKATRGLHYAGPNARFVFPDEQVALDPEVQEFLSKEAAREGIPLDRLVNEMLKKEIEILKHGRR